MLMDDECLFFCLAWAPHSVSPQSSSKIFFKRFLEILLQQSNELRKLGEFELLNTPLTSRINTTKYALHFPFHSRGCFLRFPQGSKKWCCDSLCISGFHLWCEDACASIDNFCKSPVNDEKQPERREKASTLSTELNCVPYVLFSHPKPFYRRCFAFAVHAVYTLQSAAFYTGWGLRAPDSPWGSVPDTLGTAWMS